MEQSKLTTDLMIKELESNDVTHVVWLPDTETSFLYQSISKNNQIKIIPICREGESIPLAAGLWIGGKKPVVMIQNTGLFESKTSSLNETSLNSTVLPDIILHSFFLKIV